MEYTDLELEEKIADLEGTAVHNCLDNTRSFPRYANNLALTFNLMVKYKVSINRDFEYVEIDNDTIYNQKAFKSESEIPRAIIMCILTSENII